MYNKQRGVIKVYTNVTVERVEIQLDDNVPECMDGIIRIGSVIVYLPKNILKNHQELVDNLDFYTEEEIINSVAQRLNIDKDFIEIIA